MVEYFIEQQSVLLKVLQKAESDLLQSAKHKFGMTKKWRNDFVPDFPGVYALFEMDTLLYIGESGNLKLRMADLCRTMNHAFRRQLGQKRFGADHPKLKKFTDETERLLDDFFDQKLYVSFIQVNFGRIEIEEYLIAQYQNLLLNSEKKRKLKMALDNPRSEIPL